METKIQNEISQDQIDLLKEKLKLENQAKGEATWFYWIAGLSIINSMFSLPVCLY